MKFRVISVGWVIGLLLLAGCGEPEQEVPAMLMVRGLNYTPHPITRFHVKVEDDDMTGGGWVSLPPVGPDGKAVRDDNEDKAHADLPPKWTPGMQVTVRWLVDKGKNGNGWGSWYKARVNVPEYGQDPAYLWASFLPDDRVGLTLFDLKVNPDDEDNAYHVIPERPRDDDPRLAVGTVDEQYNRKEEEILGRMCMLRDARKAELGNKGNAK